MRDGGGEPDGLAPVIPLFGRTAKPAAPADDTTPETTAGRPDPGSHTAPSAGSGLQGRQQGVDDTPSWRSTWSDDVSGRLPRPVTPIESPGPSDRHPARGRASKAAPRLRALQSDEPQAPEEQSTDPARLRAEAEELLVQKLRTRSLSISEARMVLKGFGKDPDRLHAGTVDDILDDFCRRGYLDDAVLAGQLVASGVERKGQGRVALSRALAQRGIPRDVIDAALDELPDDDAERALDYARTKARGLARLDGDAALRRLIGQLSRRGYNGSVAMTAAKTALAEVSFGRPTSGVRFVDSD